MSTRTGLGLMGVGSGPGAVGSTSTPVGQYGTRKTASGTHCISTIAESMACRSAATTSSPLDPLPPHAAIPMRDASASPRANDRIGSFPLISSHRRRADQHIQETCGSRRVLGELLCELANHLVEPLLKLDETVGRNMQEMITEVRRRILLHESQLVDQRLGEQRHEFERESAAFLGPRCDVVPAALVDLPALGLDETAVLESFLHLAHERFARPSGARPMLVDRLPDLLVPLRERDPRAVVGKAGDRLAHRDRELAVVDSGDGARRREHPVELPSEGVDRPVTPKNRQELVRVLLADRGHAADEGLAGKALALLDVAEHHWIDRLAENFVGEAPHGVLAAHGHARLVEDVFDALQGARGLAHAATISGGFTVVQTKVAP